MPKRLPQGEPSGLYAAVIFAIAAAVVACCGCADARIIERNRTRFAVIAFVSEHCRPCKAAGPKLDKLAEQCAVTRVDIDQSPEMADRFDIVAVPTFVVLHGRYEWARLYNADDLLRVMGVSP